MSHSFEAVEGQYLLTSCPLPPYTDSQGSNVAVRLSFFDDFVPDESFSNYYAGASGDMPWTACSQNPFTIFCLNIGKELYIYSQESQSIPIDRRIFKAKPTYHAFKQNSSDASLLVGLSTGEIQLIYPTRRDFCKTFNEEKTVDKTSVTCISWVPNSPNQFVVSHMSGNFYLYDEKLVPILTAPTYESFKETIGFSVYTCKTKSTRNPLYRWVFGGRVTSDSSSSLLSMDFPFVEPHAPALQHEDGCSRDAAALVTLNQDHASSNSLQCFPSGGVEDAAVNQFAFSPCGFYLAVVTQDGYLRVVVYHAMELYGYMRSYFAGLLCVDWSPDSCYIAVGGQDDLVTVWSMAERTVICRCEGHRSWVSTVRFDPFLCPTSSSDGPLTRDRKPPGVARAKCLTLPNSNVGSVSVSQSYRLGSVGQDTIFCLWDLADDIIRQGLSFARESSQLSTEGDQSRANPDPMAPSTLPPGLGTQKSSPTATTSSTGTKTSFRLSLSAQAKSHARLRTALGHDANQSSSSSVRNLLGFLTINKRKSSSRSHHSNTLALVDGDHAIGSHPTSSQPRHAHTWNRCDGPASLRHLPNGDSSGAGKELRVITDLTDQPLLGSPMCPRFEDVPVLEPVVCTVMHQHRLTDLVFRRETVHVVCQQGLIRCWSRPARLKSGEMVEDTSNESDSFSANSSGAPPPPPPPPPLADPVVPDTRSTHPVPSDRYYRSASHSPPTAPSLSKPTGMRNGCQRIDQSRTVNYAPNGGVQCMRTGLTVGNPTATATGGQNAALNFGYSGVGATDGSRLYGPIGPDINCTDV